MKQKQGTAILTQFPVSESYSSFGLGGISTDYLLDYHEGSNHFNLQELSMITKMPKMSTAQQQLLHSIDRKSVV